MQLLPSLGLSTMNISLKLSVFGGISRLHGMVVWKANVATKEEPPPKKKFSLLPKVINGGIAGFVGVTVVFPIDLVKTRIQNQKPGPNGELLYKNAFDCFKKTITNEGIFAMYRGSISNRILVFPEKAIQLASNDMFRFYLTLPDGSLSVPRQILAAALAGTCQISVTTPMELLKIQSQDAGRVAAVAKAEGRTVKHQNSLQLAINLVKERGIFGLYRGLSATAARDISFAVVYFPTFSFLSGFCPMEPGLPTPPFWCTFLSGLTAGSAAAYGVNPLDVVKTRLQSLSGDSRQYKGWVDCIKTIWKEEGPKAFLKGGVPRVMVIAPLFGIAQVIYFIGLAENYLGVT